MALDFFPVAGQVESARRLGAALWFHWVFSGRVAEGRWWWLERVLAGPGPRTADLASALWTCSLLASQQGDLASSARLAEAAYEVAVAAADADVAGDSGANSSYVAQRRPRVGLGRHRADGVVAHLMAWDWSEPGARYR